MAFGKASLEVSLATAPWHRQGSTQDGSGLITKAAPPQGSVLQNTMTLPEYRQAIVEIYSIHKPDNVMKVDYLLEKYRGNEEYLFRSICTKYEVDPSRWSSQSSLAPVKPTPTLLPPPPPPPPVPCGGPVWQTSPPAVQTKAKSRYHLSGPPVAIQNGGMPTRSGIGYQAPPPAPLKQKHEVMEWDPATGQMVATTIEIETGDLPQAAPAPVPAPCPPQEVKMTPPPPPMVVVPTIPKQAAPTPATPLMPAAAQAAAAAALVPSAAEIMPQEAADDEYDPFAEGMDLPQGELDIIDIDRLLLGERSGFFEAVKLGAPKADEPSCVGPGRPESAAISRVSTSDSMEVDAVAGDASKASGAPHAHQEDQPMTEADTTHGDEGQAASFDPYLGAVSAATECEGEGAPGKKDDVAAQTVAALATFQ